MTLKKLIGIANKAYPEGLLKMAFEDQQKLHPLGMYDALAVFIVRELTDSYDKNMGNTDQLDEAIYVMQKAQTEIGAVAAAFAEYTAKPIKIKRATPQAIGD